MQILVERFGFQCRISGVSDIQTESSCDLFLSAERAAGRRICKCRERAAGGASARRGLRDPVLDEEAGHHPVRVAEVSEPEDRGQAT